jgi:hypothetical protein
MLKLMRWIPALVGAAGISLLALAGSGCDGKFAGPPGGSAIGTPGTYPLFGVTPFTFSAENPGETGFYNDIWFIDPGRDADDNVAGQIIILADTIQAMQTANFSGFLTNLTDALHIEVNFQYPTMLSFMSQWFRRNGDGSRIKERDAFGFLVWSSKSLAINFITAPVEPFFTPPPVRLVYGVDRLTYPNGLPGSVLAGWTSPPWTQPGEFPPPQNRFLSKNFSELGLVTLTKLLPAGSPQLTQSLGLPMADNPDNENVENAGAIPIQAVVGGTFSTITAPTGVFGDLYALAYKSAPVIKPTSPGHTELEAAIEYSRHMGALQTNLVTQMIGLASGKQGTLTDPDQVVWQNGYGYTFDQNDLDDLNTKHLPGKDRDPFANRNSP